MRNLFAVTQLHYLLLQAAKSDLILKDVSLSQLIKLPNANPAVAQACQQSLLLCLWIKEV